MDPLTIGAALLPVVGDFFKGLIGRFVNPEAKPANIQEVLQLRASDIDRLKALAELDRSEGAAQWVQNVRGMQRPVAIGASLLAFFGCLMFGAPETYLEMSGNMASAALFYLLGDRTLMYAKRGG